MQMTWLHYRSRWILAIASSMLTMLALTGFALWRDHVDAARRPIVVQLPSPDVDQCTGVPACGGGPDRRAARDAAGDASGMR
jgi:hypothetical protein